MTAVVFIGCLDAASLLRLSLFSGILKGFSRLELISIFHFTVELGYLILSVV